MSPEAKKPLGRGLPALLGDAAGETGPVAAGPRAAKLVPVGAIRPNEYQPRRQFTKDEMEELTRSVRAHGVLQPILVRRDPKDANRYELIAGERRWRAAQAAQLHEIPAVVRDLTDTESLELALIENLQREDLTPVEEARAFRRLMTEFGHTQEKLGQALGKSRSLVANTLQKKWLIDLPEQTTWKGADDKQAVDLTWLKGTTITANYGPQPPTYSWQGGGKWTKLPVAWLPDGASRGDLYLASVATRVVTPPSATFEALGLRTERRYYRRMLERLGVRMDRSSIGDYKSAYRNYSVDSTPPADTVVIQRMLEQRQTLFVNAVANGRKVPAERFQSLLDGGSYEEIGRAHV